MATILFVISASDHWTLIDGSTHPTGYWAEEVATPYRVLTEAGHTVVAATPGGVVPTPDPTSLTPESTGGADNAAQIRATLAEFATLNAPLRLEDVSARDYAAVFYPGGHGPMEDLAVDPTSGELLTTTVDSGIPLGVLCHAPAALLAARRADGSWPFAGYRMTGFTNTEESQAGLADQAPWLLQDRLTELGADFVSASPWSSHVVADRGLYTGQNPASSAELARTILGAIQ
ncbi:type 1 glutamine amidotransferase domain-containing protein [Lipingzhangella sp. LS1_29]|uniref:Type 1 glutamine amidotransferase domain-containing protein n=1 Tax=Lipingzhangella rawalii TaxID=2055835 RepID=A0ABU2H3V1_9ACTN|nr:type 1 glutamine amidotransferase domain-containing protein [Lipingzhangella rawalii]MDS1269284.1 type 1 glutamine amidotransferase domain-containing protein [Lipingzhangella rawalii]